MIMSQGLKGNTEESFFMKENALCQIPGFNYSYEGVARLPRPVGWLEHALREEIINDMKIVKFDQLNFTMSRDETFRYDANPSNPLWQLFTQYVCEEKID